MQRCADNMPRASPQPWHQSSSLARVRVLCLLALLAALLVGASPAQADDLSGAREVLALTQQRLSYMETVAAAKWASRSPITDSTQEAWVLATARGLATARALNADSV